MLRAGASLFACAALLAVAPSALAVPVAEQPSDVARDPLARGAWLSMPALVRIDRSVYVRALSAGDGTPIPLRADARGVVLTGTAFGVAKGGYLAAAAHAVTPTGAELALLALAAERRLGSRPSAPTALAQAVERRRIRPVGVRRGRVVVRAAVAPGQDGRSEGAVAQVVRVDRLNDVALLRSPFRRAPSLALTEAQTAQTPVAVVGFGAGSAGGTRDPHDLVPFLRRGAIVGSGAVRGQPTRRVTLVSAPILRGDSGAPVVDAAGTVHGLAFNSRPAAIVPAKPIEDLLAAVGVTPGASPASLRFHEGMSAFWRREFAGASRQLGAAREAAPRSALIAWTQGHAARLRSADYQLRGPALWRGALLAFGVLCGLAAVLCGLALVGPFRPTPRHQQTR